MISNSQKLGERLFELVEAYARIGDHRSGDGTDRQTREWLATELEARGASVTAPLPYEFPRYVADAELRAGGREVECLPLFYSGIGRTQSSAAMVARLPMRQGLVPLDLEGVLAGQPREEALVLTTDGPEGRLVAVNREPSTSASRPVVLAAGRDHHVLASAGVTMRFAARIESGASANVVADLGGRAHDPYVVTTPLTGWFRCAGERGTGIAVALEVARRLASEHPVLFVGTTGHELAHLGARAFRRAHPRLRPRAVLHLGASVAAADAEPDGALRLSSMRFAMTAAIADRAAVAAALAPAALPVVAAPEFWPGEGEEWRATGAPLLSLTGGFSAFHSRDDVAERVTSPEILAAVCEAVFAAAEGLPAR